MVQPIFLIVPYFFENFNLYLSGALISPSTHPFSEKTDFSYNKQNLPFFPK